eukprot:350019-Chlamydomonas_euryale.AAC.3
MLAPQHCGRMEDDGIPKGMQEAVWHPRTQLTHTFLAHAFVLETRSYPTVFLYPEGAPGCMRFKGALHAMHRWAANIALVSCQK